MRPVKNRSCCCPPHLLGWHLRAVEYVFCLCSALRKHWTGTNKRHRGFRPPLHCHLPGRAVRTWEPLGVSEASDSNDVCVRLTQTTQSEIDSAPRRRYSSYEICYQKKDQTTIVISKKKWICIIINVLGKSNWTTENRDCLGPGK